MHDDQTYLTADGLERLQAELRQLTTVRRREIADKIEHAKELGDLSENAEYHEAKDEQAFIEGRILELEAIVNNAHVVAAPTQSTRVSIGSSVRVTFDGNEKQFSIVGASESDPLHGRISNESPIGRALIGRTVGEEIDVQTPKGTKRATVLAIS